MTAEIIPFEPKVSIKDNTVITTSLAIAEHFRKRHKNVLRDIRELECSEKFNGLNFEPVTYLDSYGRSRSNAARWGVVMITIPTPGGMQEAL